MDSECLLWGEHASVQVDGDSTIFQSMRTDGSYRATGTFLTIWSQLSLPEQAELRPKITTWIVDQHRSGIVAPTINSNILDMIRQKRYLRHSERMERFFLMLAYQDFGISGSIKIAGVVDEESKSTKARLEAWIEARTDKDAGAFLFMLCEANLLVGRGNHRYFLTPGGYDRLEQAELGSSSSRQVFVAMWFDPQMDVVYSEGIAPAIEAAGFKPFRIDHKEHNNKFDDEIIAEIRRSRFVVADFTCRVREVDGVSSADARGGVYYEAGFAQGLGLPLIWTVRNDCISHVHFDTRQFAHIVWNDPGDLKLKLQNRILASILS
ncbi:hypothetical protein [Blastomonas aquatica]|nr:hypothetical protein [Blastomonas aquatica]